MQSIIIVIIFLCMAASYGVYQKRTAYRRIDRLLDSVLSREPVRYLEVRSDADSGNEKDSSGKPSPKKGIRKLLSLSDGRTSTEKAYADLKEGEYSALVSKVMQIQEVLNSHARDAEREKEQVKSLVSNMSHQLKTPLANLALYAEILGKEDLAPEQRIEFAYKMCRQTEKLGWIIESLSKMVKLEQNIEGFEVKSEGIKQTILDAADTVYEKLEKKELRLIMEPFEDRKLYHNRKWTAEVFVNLLENAVKYTEKGGLISIRVRPYELYTEIQIADNGRGMPQEELTDIFRRFYRSPEVENIEGSGIGLYLSNLILEKEKGYITAASVYGEGSCFSVFLQNCKN